MALPHAVNKLKPSVLFEAKTIVKHKKQKLNSTASELLCVIPILAHFVRVACLPTGTHTKKIEVFEGLRLTAGRRRTRVCVGLGRVHLQLSGAYRALGGGKVGNCSALETGAGSGAQVKLSGAHLGPRLGQVGPMWSMN